MSLAVIVVQNLDWQNWFSPLKTSGTLNGVDTQIPRLVQLEKGRLPRGDEPKEAVRKAAIKILAEEQGESLQVGVIKGLVDGPRSVAELVEEIYGVVKGEPSYMTSYTRTRRALAKLSARGMVSRKVFGSTKPYRLTRHARESLASYATGSDPPSLFPRIDRVVHASAITVAIALTLSLSGRIQVGQPLLSVLQSMFFFTLGLSTARVAQGLRRVV